MPTAVAVSSYRSGASWVLFTGINYEVLPT